MTIIYSNWNDDDCRCLQRVWQGIPDVNVIEITSDMNDWDWHLRNEKYSFIPKNIQK
jgi:hypothetical protein